MRNRRTSFEARLTVTLSFSAHSTGSLAFVTSTARRSGDWALPEVPTAHTANNSPPTIAASAARAPLPLAGRGWGWG